MDQSKCAATELKEFFLGSDVAFALLGDGYWRWENGIEKGQERCGVR